MGSGGDAVSIYQAIKMMWNGSSKVSLEEAASSPYASIGVRLGGSQEIMLILASDENGQQLWTSAARLAITTQGGRIVRTAGFDHNLGGYESRADTTGDDGTRIVHWQADFPDLGLYSVPVSCRVSRAVYEVIVVLGANIRTHRVDESCVAKNDKLDWSFKNTFWRDPKSGLAWRSIQHVHPNLDAIDIEILRPPA